MWLLELFKAKDSAIIGEDGMFSTDGCDLSPYIDTDNYTPELNLCNSWDNNAKKILILKKKPEQITLGQLQNERFIEYGCTITSNSTSAYSY